jgi:hypothetical protein
MPESGQGFPINHAGYILERSAVFVGAPANTVAVFKTTGNGKINLALRWAEQAFLNKGSFSPVSSI